MLNAFLILLLFLAMQLIGTLGATLWYATDAQLTIDAALFAQPLPSSVKLVAFGMSMLLTIAVLWTARLVRRRLKPQLPLSAPRQRVWRGTGWLIMGFWFAEKFVTLCCELLAIPNLYAAEFEGMLAYPWLMLAVVCLVGPVAEEFVFREGILRQLHLWQSNKFWAVVLSALCFGVVHINPAQVFSATLLGALLGWVYVRTGDARQSIVLHIINNLTAFALGYAATHWGWPDTLQGLLLLPLPTLPWWGNLVVFSCAGLVLGGIALYALCRWSRVADPMPDRDYFEH